MSKAAPAAKATTTKKSGKAATVKTHEIDLKGKNTKAVVPQKVFWGQLRISPDHFASGRLEEFVRGEQVNCRGLGTGLLWQSRRFSLSSKWRIKIWSQYGHPSGLPHGSLRHCASDTPRPPILSVNGPCSLRSESLSSSQCALALDHSQSSALATSPARTGARGAILGGSVQHIVPRDGCWDVPGGLAVNAPTASHQTQRKRDLWGTISCMTACCGLVRRSFAASGRECWYLSAAFLPC